jgi:hypothetical protein
MAMLQAFRGNAHHARGAGILASAMTWRRREGNRRQKTAHGGFSRTSSRLLLFRHERPARRGICRPAHLPDKS